MTSALNWYEVEASALHCGRLSIDPPQSVTKGLHLLEVARSTIAAPSGPLLGLSDAKMPERVEQLSIRVHKGDSGEVQRGMKPGVQLVEDQLAAEVASAVVPELDDLITGLQPRFAEAAEPMHVAAQEFGIKSMTDSDQIIDRPDFEAAGAAWKAMKTAWGALFPLVQWRIDMSKRFRLSPTYEETKQAGHSTGTGDLFGINYSVLFADGDGWSLNPDRYHVGGDRRENFDWLQLARSGMRLNTVTEVQAKVQKRVEADRRAASPPGPINADLDDYRYPTPRR